MSLARGWHLYWKAYIAQLTNTSVLAYLLYLSTLHLWRNACYAERRGARLSVLPSIHLAACPSIWLSILPSPRLSASLWLRTYPLRHLSFFFQVGERIRVILDCDDNTLAFERNYEFLGVAFRGEVHLSVADVTRDLLLKGKKAQYSRPPH